MYKSTSTSLNYIKILGIFLFISVVFHLFGQPAPLSTPSREPGDYSDLYQPLPERDNALPDIQQYNQTAELIKWWQNELKRADRLTTAQTTLVARTTYDSMRRKAGAGAFDSVPSPKSFENVKRAILIFQKDSRANDNIWKMLDKLSPEEKDAITSRQLNLLASFQQGFHSLLHLQLKQLNGSREKIDRELEFIKQKLDNPESLDPVEKETFTDEIESELSDIKDKLETGRDNKKDLSFEIVDLQKEIDELHGKEKILLESAEKKFDKSAMETLVGKKDDAMENIIAPQESPSAEEEEKLAIEIGEENEALASDEGVNELITFWNDLLQLTEKQKKYVQEFMAEEEQEKALTVQNNTLEAKKNNPVRQFASDEEKEQFRQKLFKQQADLLKQMAQINRMENVIKIRIDASEKVFNDKMKKLDQASQEAFEAAKPLWSAIFEELDSWPDKAERWKKAQKARENFMKYMKKNVRPLNPNLIKTLPTQTPTP
ncbi:MAG: hypothetical protein NT106_14530 [Candidatus Sumerlaeota bacterium]|nr:hypothetical protein [Candidatus Sumerlaeota bacterium]